MDFVAITWCCLRLVPVNNRQTKRPKKNSFHSKRASRKDGRRESHLLLGVAEQASTIPNVPLPAAAFHTIKHSLSHCCFFPHLPFPGSTGWCKGLLVPPGSFPHSSSRNLYLDPWLLFANHEIMWMPPRQLVNPQRGLGGAAESSAAASSAPSLAAGRGLGDCSQGMARIR